MTPPSEAPTAQGHTGLPTRALAYKLCAPHPPTSANGRTLGASSMPARVSVPPSGAVAVIVAVEAGGQVFLGGVEDA